LTHSHTIKSYSVLFDFDKCVRILPCIQEEMMVQKDPIELEKMKAWSRRRKADQGKL